jgi:hypothetical protein
MFTPDAYLRPEDNITCPPCERIRYHSYTFPWTGFISRFAHFIVFGKGSSRAVCCFGTSVSILRLAQQGVYDREHSYLAVRLGDPGTLAYATAD